MLVSPFRFDVCVVGGCGHVGLPLAIALANHGFSISVHDTDDSAVAQVRAGHMPFREEGAGVLLRKVVGASLRVSNDPGLVTQSRVVIVVIGTPVDEHLNPTFYRMKRFFIDLLPRLVDGQCVILRSTIYPGTTEKIAELLAGAGRKISVAFCPERVAEGHALQELAAFPQIVSGCDERAIDIATEIFAPITKSIIVLPPMEAELMKMFANAWRYIQFAAANEFFIIASECGLDFHRIYDALTRDYPRMAGLPSSGFAGGPCLFKDTMQLAAFDNHKFSLGHAAMLINEGLPNFVVRRLKSRQPLSHMRVGLLGMAFKAESDDPRESLSYKLRKILEYEAAEVLCTDVYIRDPTFISVEEIIRRADIIIVGAPHQEYRSLAFPATTRVIDIWNIYGKGSSLV